MRSVLEADPKHSTDDVPKAVASVTPHDGFLSLAALMLESPESLEQFLVAHFVQTCRFCAHNQTMNRWYSLCETHALISRSITEPEYAAAMRQELQEARKREEAYLEALPRVERADKGRAWIAENEDDPKYAVAAKALHEIIESLPAELRTLTLDATRERIVFLGRQRAYYEARLELLEAWSLRIPEILEEIYGAASPTD